MKLSTAALALVATGASAAPSTHSPRQDAAGLTYQEITGAGITFRVAIPQVDAAPFDVSFQIIAPSTAGWAGIGWGGGMLNNPLVVAWPNGDTVIASSRTAPGYMPPGPYAGAEYILGPGTTVNATHWVLDAVCKGCSQWAGGGLNPAGASVPLAWAYNTQPVMQPASNTSSFAAHLDKGVLPINLAGARNANFDEVIAGGADPGAAPPAAPPTAPPTAPPAQPGAP